jgi:hypothetical protein
MMTFEQCQAILKEIRRRQGTEHPLIQVTCSGTVIRGRLTRTDTDRHPGSNPHSPFGLLVLEQPGLLAGPLSFVQIANIPDDGLCEHHLREDAHAHDKQLVGAQP